VPDPYDGSDVGPGHACTAARWILLRHRVHEGILEIAAELWVGVVVWIVRIPNTFSIGAHPANHEAQSQP
jgi:hypothetical protein